ncbi:MAG: hypothetical protein DHS20C18_25540 [Saprospiraceae bacterium]|nr:MAG: hypothetical protein DHS20C18_25540 [Saprospiraceae bacterium]
MNLKNFETIIEEKIVARGFSYYENEQVEDFEQVEKGEFSATIFGTDQYAIFIKLDKTLEIIEHSCDCPYDWGDYCKHVVATLYYIRDNESYKKKPDHSGKIATIKKELAGYTKKELKELILDIAKNDGRFKHKLLWHLGHEEEF